MGIRKLILLGAISSLILGALPVSADYQTSGDSGQQPQTQSDNTNTMTATSQEVAACMKPAIDRRDTAIINAVDAYHAAIRTALVNRRDALQEAWNQTNSADKMQKMRLAWSQFRVALRNARREFRMARVSAWTIFKSDRLECDGFDDGVKMGIDARL